VICEDPEQTPFHEPTQRFGKDKDGNFKLCLAQIFGRLNRQVQGAIGEPGKAEELDLMR
jgi:hypothetical protein